MGLGFSHCDAHWGYIGFMRFRTKLAEEIGIKLMDMKGFSNMFGQEGKELKWDNIDDSIKLLLWHSDCDGELTVEECKLVAPRLRELVKDWDDDDHDKQQALELASGMEFAIESNEELVFC